MADRDEEARAAGLPLGIVLGGETHDLPVLTIAKSRRWKVLVQDRLGQFFAEMTPELGSRLMTLGTDTLEDLLYAYDDSRALPEREALEEIATDQELFAAVRKLVDESFPLEGGLATVMAAAVEVARSRPPSSTNGRSTTGRASARPKSSTRSSPTGN